MDLTRLVTLCRELGQFAENYPDAARTARQTHRTYLALRFLYGDAAEPLLARPYRESCDRLQLRLIDIRQLADRSED